jgi:leader peptidase (prepilin peptidase) / N-methyltransferase
MGDILILLMTYELIYHAIVLISVAVYGLIVGSFLNVVVDRIPHRLSLLGRSHCDHCGKKLGYFDLIPVISYIITQGKSRCCNKNISIKYPLVEGLTGFCFLLATYFYTFTSSNSQTINSLYFLPGLIVILAMVSISITIAIVDFRHMIILDGQQLICFICAVIWSLLMGRDMALLLSQATIPALIILAIYLLTKSRGMGYADVKLAYCLGIWLGFEKSLLGIYFGFILGAVYGMILMIKKRANRKSHIAFGPFLLIGGWLSFYLFDLIYPYIKLLFLF